MSRTTITAIIFALGFFMFFVLALPQYDGLANAKEALKERRSVLSERTSEFNNFKQLSRQVEARQDDIAKIKTFLPQAKHTDQVVSSIQAIAGQSGLQLVSLSTSEKFDVTSAGYKILLINVDFTGKYANFLSFLTALEQSLRLYDIFEMTITPATSGGVGNLTFSLKMNAYFLK